MYIYRFHQYPFSFSWLLASKEMFSYPNAGMIIAGVLVLALACFGLTMLGCCSCSRISSLPTRQANEKSSGCKSLESHSITFQYKKDAGSVQGTHHTDCSICLTAFDEDDCMRQLSNCKHIFHKVCIDQWLGSHSGCPFCRTKIDKVDFPNGIVTSERWPDDLDHC